MDKHYEKNFIKPTDKNFEYDKRVDFSKVQRVDESWDVDGDEDDIEEDIIDDYSDAFD